MELDTLSIQESYELIEFLVTPDSGHLGISNNPTGVIDQKLFRARVFVLEYLPVRGSRKFTITNEREGSNYVCHKWQFSKALAKLFWLKCKNLN
jgi:hypothetical protein